MTQLNKLLDSLGPQTEVIIQGITGKEGGRVAEFMINAQVKVVAGVRPGKGGEQVMGIPVYDSVTTAVSAHPSVTVSCVYVPPAFVLAAASEAISAKIPLVHIIAEGVPVADSAKLISLSKSTTTHILGPSSLGLIKPQQFKLGSIGGDDNSSFSPGPVGVISRSGGMSSEVSYMLTKSAIGQSTVIHVGGDYLIGITPKDTLEYFQQDPHTQAVLLVGEVGGRYELAVAQMLAHKQFNKPLIVFLAGQFVESLPQGVPLGHAGAIIGGKAETRQGKMDILRQSGATIVTTPDKIVPAVQQFL